MMVALTMSAITYQDQVSLTVDDGTYMHTIVLGEASELPAGINNGYASEIQNLDEMPLAVYALYNGVKYCPFVMKSYENQPLGIKTTNETTYTLYFDDVTGTVNLYDKKTGAPVPVTEGGDYEFTISNEEKNSLLNDRFYINYDPTAFVTSATTNEYGYATFSYTADVKPAMPAGLKVYKGTLAGETLTLSEVADVPANIGVVLFGAPNTTYQFAATTATADMTGNVLLPSSDWTAATENAYFLVGNEFKKYTGTDDVPDGKAYLIFAGSSNNAPKRIVMRFNETEETQGIEKVQGDNVPCTKFVENGQVFIRRGNEVYNLQGQIVK